MPPPLFKQCAQIPGQELLERYSAGTYDERMNRVEGGSKLREAAAGGPAAALYLYRDTTAAAVDDKVDFVIPLTPIINLIVQFLGGIEDMRSYGTLYPASP